MKLLAKKYYMGAGFGKGFTRITSFDEALLNAGVGNYNLVRLSSILPIKTEKVDKVDLPLGSLLPIAYATITTNTKGQRVSSAVAIGYPKNKENKCNVIMEYEDFDTEENVVNTVVNMVKEGFKYRDWEIEKIEIVSSSCVSENGEYATAFACLAEW